MKLPAFDNASRRWDTFKAFHVALSGGFIQFESGELIYQNYGPDPNDRNTFIGGSVQIVSTSDTGCPRLYLPDGTGIPTAWLERKGRQYLCIDRDLGVAVRLMGRRWNQKAELPEQDMRVPEYLRTRFAVYWSGEGSRPIANPITVAPPRKFTPDERDQLQGLKDQCVAWCAIHNIEPVMYKRTVTMPESGKLTPVDAVAVDPLNVLGVSMLTLTEVHRIQIASLGYTPCYDATKHKYLKVR